MKKLLIGLFLCSLLVQPACKNAASKNEDSGALLGFGVGYLNSIWKKCELKTICPLLLSRINPI